MKRKAFISLLLLIPAPSIGVLFGMVWMPGTLIGNSIYLFCKAWILFLPALWFFYAEGGRFSRPRTLPGGLRMGLLTGLAASVAIGALYLMFGERLIDPATVRELAAGIKLDRKLYYAGSALNWICINSLLEEYVWRWFVMRQCVRLMKPSAAMLVSALGFALHHVLAMQLYLSGPLTLLGGVGVFSAGLLWAWLFIRYKTIWPGWLSHVLVDIAVFGIGYVLIFG
ncbi:MAG: CPBP family intramembrane metalloprotease [Kiritimatiellales bacterium]|nr:CPBP family intramembrane metalloprotease [Kiritimatiellales bacterium]